MHVKSSFRYENAALNVLHTVLKKAKNTILHFFFTRIAYSIGFKFNQSERPYVSLSYAHFLPVTFVLSQQQRGGGVTTFVQLSMGEVKERCAGRPAKRKLHGNRQTGAIKKKKKKKKKGDGAGGEGGGGGGGGLSEC